MQGNYVNSMRDAVVLCIAGIKRCLVAVFRVENVLVFDLHGRYQVCTKPKEGIKRG